MTMTKDEALRGLTIGDCRTRREAVKTVKELLNREECEDAVNRQLVLDICDKYNGQGYIWSAIRGEVEKLPPVRPTYSDEEIQKMQDLEQAEIQKAYELGKEEGKESEDAISRQTAIDTVEKWLECKDYNEAERHIMRATQSMLYDLPPVIPQPKTEWIPVSERLPEKNMACLVTVGELNLVQIAMYSDLMKTINHRVFYQGNFGEDDFRAITQYVKAWMPLPEPYKESEGEE